MQRVHARRGNAHPLHRVHRRAADRALALHTDNPVPGNAEDDPQNDFNADRTRNDTARWTNHDMPDSRDRNDEASPDDDEKHPTPSALGASWQALKHSCTRDVSAMTKRDRPSVRPYRFTRTRRSAHTPPPHPGMQPSCYVPGSGGSSIGGVAGEGSRSGGTSAGGSCAGGSGVTGASTGAGAGKGSCPGVGTLAERVCSDEAMRIGDVLIRGDRSIAWPM